MKMTVSHGLGECETLFSTDEILRVQKTELDNFKMGLFSWWLELIKPV